MIRARVHLTRAACVTLAALLLGPAARAQAPRALSDSAFAALIARISEAGGFFNTDNLISNEDSYLHPVTTLRKLGAIGGTYIGVGPDQNFSYIAVVRPSVAFIVDIRRDNMLEHLLFKALFAGSRIRADYLALLFGRNPPADTTGLSAAPIDSLLARIDREKPDPAAAGRARARVMNELRRMQVVLSDSDRATITRFHNAFIQDGPALRFNTFGRAPQSYYPDFRRLAHERDREGRLASFLSTEALFRVVLDLQARNLIVPVVGDFGGPRALAGVAEWMQANNERLTAFYTSNVEQYLFRDGGFAQFAANVERIPRRNNAVIIRSCFVCAFTHPQRVNGYHAVQVLQFVDRFSALRASGALLSYDVIVSTELVPPN